MMSRVRIPYNKHNPAYPLIKSCVCAVMMQDKAYAVMVQHKSAKLSIAVLALSGPASTAVLQTTHAGEDCSTLLAVHSAS